MDYSESCAVSGLEIKHGDPVFFLLACDTEDDQSGPFKHFYPETPVMPGAYNGTGGVHPDSDEPEDHVRGLLAYTMCGQDGLNTLDEIDSEGLAEADRYLVMIVPSVWQLLRELPMADGSGIIGRLADDYLSELVEAAKPLVKSEAAGQEGDSGALYTALYGAADLRNEGWTNACYHVDESPFCESMANAMVVMQAEVDLWTLHEGLKSARRPLVPACGATTQKEGNEGVSALARMVRRKALTAGFAPAD